MFAAQMANILLFSIIMPLLISAFMIAYSTPLVIIRSKQWKKTTESTLELVIARIFIVLFFLIVPAIIILESESAKEERKSLKRKSKEKDDLINSSQSSDFLACFYLFLTLMWLACHKESYLICDEIANF